MTKFKNALVGAILGTVITGFTALPSQNILSANEVPNDNVQWNKPNRPTRTLDSITYLLAEANGTVEKIFYPKDSITKDDNVIAIIRPANMKYYSVVRTRTNGDKISRCFIKEGDNVRARQRLFEIHITNTIYMNSDPQ